ncbi:MULTISPECIES: gluconate 2-dehydrogenase subunit 3 family protein [unclassified Polaribacter]|uniref:gluconate 2-dehydrogenase subunit 3 family protein n=1 Tax=unclassified Polaribacter TaxID=196858 RepID=UPI001407CE4E|nr:MULTISPECIES: gluconate 2-dehydrogenase subunit 3 family protein [unclassified Polaribacter]
MDRRKALKSMSLAIGGFVITPSILSIFASCTSDKVDVNYLFLSKEQSLVMNHLVAVVLPISNVNIHYTSFIDKMLYHTVSKENKQLFIAGYLEFEKNYQRLFNQEILKVNTSNIQKIVEKYFSISKQKEEAVFTLLEKDFSLVDENQKSKYLNYYFLTNVRYYCLLGYCTSEYYEKPV